MEESCENSMSENYDSDEYFEDDYGISKFRYL